jgi:hypothetical protein
MSESVRISKRGDTNPLEETLRKQVKEKKTLFLGSRAHHGV